MWTKRFLSALFRCFVPERLWHAYNNVAKIKKELKGKRRKKKKSEELLKQRLVSMFIRLCTASCYIFRAQICGCLSDWRICGRSTSIELLQMKDNLFPFFFCLIHSSQWICCLLFIIYCWYKCMCLCVVSFSANRKEWDKNMWNNYFRQLLDSFLFIYSHSMTGFSLEWQIYVLYAR